ncbi:hypothetical protein BC936DRAFT_141713 [Jimgerdemannia flammicorona]|uniref:Uncharacterized protein n=1 Tax=Jimgerdemannia flammicorona TaxID=994334 RepID=A0A433DFU9_9FUNG|nr:hypothetical protein BC936DRAFT_141713 [Jimgerdemannia flammicorona]
MRHILDAAAKSALSGFRSLAALSEDKSNVLNAGGNQTNLIPF